MHNFIVETDDQSLGIHSILRVDLVAFNFIIIFPFVLYLFFFFKCHSVVLLVSRFLFVRNSQCIAKMINKN